MGVYISLWPQKCLIIVMVVLIFFCKTYSANAEQIITAIKMDGTTGIAGQHVFSSAPGFTAIDGKTYGSLISNGSNGKNLFFSFDKFSIGSGATVQFQYSNFDTISNVISRVTGSDATKIDGTLSSNIPSANFWFFNPMGIAFGQNAVVDVPAGFHVGAVDNIVLKDDNKFNSLTNLNGSSLIIADPKSFDIGVGIGSLDVLGSNIVFNNSGNIEITAANNLNINSGTKLTINNTGDAILRSSGDLNLGQNSSIYFNNTGSLNVSASKNLKVDENATILANNLGSATLFGNNITISNGGLVEKKVGNHFSIEAATGLSITGAYSAINAQNNGSFTVKAGTDLNIDNYGIFNVTNNGDSAVTAAKIFKIDSAAIISATNSGALKILAGSDLVVSNNSQVYANNLGETIIGAGKLLNGDSAMTGNLSVGTGGLIAKNQSGRFTVAATGDITIKNANSMISASNAENSIVDAKGAVLIDQGGAINFANSMDASINSGANLIVENGSAITASQNVKNLSIVAGGDIAIQGVNSKLIADNLGDLTLSANAVKPQPSITNDSTQYAFRLVDGGVIEKNNIGDINVFAQTVYLSGLNALVGSTAGGISFSKRPNSDQSYFQMKSARILNIGPVTVSDYTFNMDVSGVKSNNSANFKIYNKDYISLKNMLTGVGSSNDAISFIDAPNITVSDASDAILSKLVLPVKFGESDPMSRFADSPCGNRGKSTLNEKNLHGYIREAQAQVPVSISELASGLSLASMSGSGESTTEAHDISAILLNDTFGC